MNILNQSSGTGWNLYHGDCVEVLKGLPDNSVGMTIFSPPFAGLYVYSNSDRDLGNSKTDDDFCRHFHFVVEQLFRVTKPGRIVAFHCMNIPAMKERDGYIGLKPFRDDLTRMFLAAGFYLHSEHVIWKDPLIEATRTKALGLMHKQLCKDSSMVRAGIPDYLIAVRKPGTNSNPIPHEGGLTEFIGQDAPTIKGESDVMERLYSYLMGRSSCPERIKVRSHEYWRRYASPVWMDIDQSRTLNRDGAREEKDERHICPLQLDVIDRALVLWSNPGDVVLSPFAGIGSEGYQAVKHGRKFIGLN